MKSILHFGLPDPEMHHLVRHRGNVEGYNSPPFCILAQPLDFHSADNADL